MKLFKHEGPGHYIGSLVLLFAEDKESAEVLVRAELAAHGLVCETVRVEEVEIKPGIFYSADGDY